MDRSGFEKILTAVLFLIIALVVGTSMTNFAQGHFTDLSAGWFSFILVFLIIGIKSLSEMDAKPVDAGGEDDE